MVDLFITDEITANEEEYVKTHLFAYNTKVAPPISGELALNIHFVLKNLDEEIYGGLFGKIYRNCLFVEILWVSEQVRGCGYGKQLMGEAEKMARAEACTFIHLDTFSFQAPNFYQKIGFEVFGVLDNYLDGSKRYFLKKTII